MGKRSRRQRAAEAPQEAAAEPIRGSGARARKARLQQKGSRAGGQAHRRLKERPPAPWDPFPLTELSIFFGIVLLIIGIVVGGSIGKGLLASGFLLVCIGGLETMLREHFGGFRSHAGVLSTLVGALALVLTTAVLNIGIPARAAIVIAVFVTIYPALRRGFIRKSGGRGVL
jgi:hypothetical protein